MEIYLVRHTTPAIKKGVCYGQTDVDLNSDTFESELREIKNKLPSNIDRFYCSIILVSEKKICSCTSYKVGFLIVC